MSTKLKLLDCTLRDGGYVNEWEFGHDNIVTVFERLISSKVDIVEIGFLNENWEVNENRTIQPGTESMDLLYQGLDKKGTMVVGMIDYGTCDISLIGPCADSFMDGIRVIFKKEKMQDAISFCHEIKKLGYQVFAQAVSITSYDDEELMELLELINELEPYAFSLVDTYGLLHKGQLLHYFEMSDRHLKPSIGIGYHSHNNFQLAYANCIELIEKKLSRELVIDGSLYGMGKSAGNAPIELLAVYLNENKGKSYKIYHLLEAIDTTILEIFRRIPWGYSFKFFVSASNECHPNYVSYLMEKKKLSVKSINQILEKLEPQKKLNYDKAYIEKLYIEYQKRECNDKESLRCFGEAIAGKRILLLGPGQKVDSCRDSIKAYQQEAETVTIAVNFIPQEVKVDYVFLSNAKRYIQLVSKLSKKKGALQLLATSNVTKAEGEFDYTFSYSRWLDEQAMIVDNPLIMFLGIMKEAGVQKIALAGFDGYVKAESANYVNPNMEYAFSRQKAKEINEDTINSLRRLHNTAEIEWITPSLYEGYDREQKNEI